MSDGSSPIELYRTRSATGVINVTFRFLRDQFGPLLKGLLLLGGPPLIVASTLGSFLGLDAALQSGSPGLFLAQVACALVGGVVVAAVSIGALDLYHREGRASLTVRRLWGLVQTHGLALFGRQIQVGLIVVVGALPALLLAVGAGTVFGGAGNEIGGLIAVGGTLILLMFGWFAYAYPRFALLMPGQVDPDRSISVRRCLRLVRGRWGQTFGVLFLAFVISMIIFSVGWIPQVIVGVLEGTGVGSAGLIGSVIAGIIGGVANALSSAVSYTALTFQYYNLVEQSEQVSLAEEVERLEQEETAGEQVSVEDSPQPERDPPSPNPDDPARWQDDPSGPQRN